jgi:hypothetical protein
VDVSWASPIGIAAFFAGTGVFFYGFFSGLAALKNADLRKHRADTP